MMGVLDFIERGHAGTVTGAIICEPQDRLICRSQKGPVWAHDEHQGWPSLTPPVIQAPSLGTPQLNVLPRETQVLVNVQTIPGQSHPGIRDDLTALAVEVENRVREYYEVYDRQLGLEGDHDLKVEVALLADRPCTKTDRQVPHHVDEWVDLDQLIETAKIYALAALHCLDPGDLL